MSIRNVLDSLHVLDCPLPVRVMNYNNHLNKPIANFSPTRERPASSQAIFIIRGVTIFQYCMVTVHLCLAFYQNYAAFTIYSDAQEAFNRLGTEPYTLSQLAIEWTNCACADSILIWRLWIFWGKRFTTVVVPITLVILSTASGYLVVWSMYQANNSTSSDFGDLFGPSVEKWAILLAVCIILTNIICTGMIAGRIWWHIRELQKVLGVDGMPNRYQAIFLGILESGALYLVAWIVAIILYLINESAIIPMLDIISQLSGIVPALIVILVSRNIGAATYHETALTTLNYRRNSFVQTSPGIEFKPQFGERESNSLEMVSITNSNDPMSPTKEGTMMSADNPSFENLYKGGTYTSGNDQH
ncbi:hypothetical protein D9757_010960 [Collybiopsis confluens]|uniref:Uncharacterized protein n=1 Tax=Collybiopsis confluens TaxID=2823264 RepID=A0A8H5GJX9_9AGAR|nr:hypothetical protein D9757_010960 [Collybiopsis confluens]